MQSPHPAPPGPAAAKKPFWHGLVALIFGLVALPVAMLGIFVAASGFSGLFLLSGAIAFVGVMLGLYAVYSNSVTGKILGVLGALPALGVVIWVLSLYG